MMTTQARAVPEGFHAVTPHLVVGDVDAAVEFYVRAFDAAVLKRLQSPDGRTMHAEIRIRDSIVMVAWVSAPTSDRSPKSIRGTRVSMHIYTEDVDSAFQRALDAGAIAKVPVAEMFWGDRYGKIVDPFGHEWSIATHKKDLSSGEVRSAAAALFGSPASG